MPCVAIQHSKFVLISVNSVKQIAKYHSRSVLEALFKKPFPGKVQCSLRNVNWTFTRGGGKLIVWYVI